MDQGGILASKIAWGMAMGLCSDRLRLCLSGVWLIIGRRRRWLMIRGWRFVVKKFGNCFLNCKKAWINLTILMLFINNHELCQSSIATENTLKLSV